MLVLDESVAVFCSGLPATVRVTAGLVTHLAGPPAILGLCALILVGCIAYRCWHARSIATDRLILIPAATLAAWSVAHVLKFLLGRYRPSEWLAHGLTGFRFLSTDQQSTSMPSGHATVAMAFLLSTSFVWPRLRIPLVVLAVVLALTRVVINAHYLSDVLAGLAVGAIVAAVTRRAMRRAFAARGAQEVQIEAD